MSFFVLSSCVELALTCIILHLFNIFVYYITRYEEENCFITQAEKNPEGANGKITKDSPLPPGLLYEI